MLRNYWLTNVCLETGFAYKDGSVSATNTGLFNLLIEEGKIARIQPAAQALSTDLPRQDARKHLLLPAFRDMHIHLDKTYYGDSWRAPSVPENGIFTRLEEERQGLPKWLPTAPARTRKILDLVLRAGTTQVRGHVNIDPVIELQNLDFTMEVVREYKDKMDIELVAFPQHGLLRSNSVERVRQALRNGATIVGGVDPATVDEDIEKSLQTTMELAVEANAGIDLHIHDKGHLGLFTFKRLAALTEEAGWQGRVTISHAYALALAEVSREEAADMAETLAAQRISIASSVPIDRPAPPIPLLTEKGVEVFLGDDSITDHWSPFGRGDALVKASVLAERFWMIDELSLSRALKYITGGITPLDEQGKQVWPKVGDAASMVLVKAGCSAEAVARKSERVAAFHKGKVVSGAL